MLPLRSKFGVWAGAIFCAVALLFLGLELGFRITRLILTAPIGYERLAVAFTIVVISALGLFRTLRRKT